MDITVLTAIACVLVTLIIAVTFIFTRKKSNDKEGNQREPVARIHRAAGVRNARRRMQARGHHQQEAQGGGDANDHSANEDNDDEEDEKIEFPEGAKVGAKKRAKLEAKAERKQQREAMEKEREDRKKAEKLLLEAADKQREKEKAEELKREEAERKVREEKEKRDHEEFLKIKATFTIEEEGFDEQDQDEGNLLQEFLEYIKYNKVVVLEDLAGHFHIKTASVIERIRALQTSGSLTGVIDDRGKFIYISQEELEAVAKFVKQRGRVSITDLAENSNKLINLIPGQGKTSSSAAIVEVL